MYSFIIVSLSLMRCPCNADKLKVKFYRTSKDILCILRIRVAIETGLDALKLQTLQKVRPVSEKSWRTSPWMWITTRKASQLM